MKMKDVHLFSNDIPLMEALLTTFGEAFNEVETYTANRPNEDYIVRKRQTSRLKLI